MLTCRPLSHHWSVIFSYISKAIFAVLGRGAILCVFILSLCLTPGTARAQMSRLSDENLGWITGQAGESIMLDGSAIVHYDLLSFSDTQVHPNWIELYNFNVDNGAGGGFSFATRFVPDPGHPLDPLLAVLMPNTLDVGTDSSGVTMAQMTDTSQMNPRWYSVGDLELKYWSGSNYYEQSLGSINLDALRIGPSVYQVWAHPASGISFDYTTAIHADAFDAFGNPLNPLLVATGGLRYHYNTTSTGVLSLSGIHIAGQATGGTDNPANPATWEFGGTSNFFKIGMIGDAANTPATIDVATDSSSNNTSLFLNLPMAGTVRVADVNFGGQSFGPIAIDGIQVHRLNVKISP